MSGNPLLDLNNLSDVSDVAIARENLDVDSKEEGQGRIDELRSLLAGDNALDVIGYKLGLTGSVLQSFAQKSQEIISVLDFGAKGDGTTDDSLAFQKALLAVHLLGGGRVYVPPPLLEYRLTYPVFLFDKTEIYGAGPSSRIVMENPTYAIRGRGNLVIGSSLEVNRDKAIAAYTAGTFPNASVKNNSFVNPAIGSFLRDNQSFVQSQYCSIHDLYLVAKYTDSSTEGGYAINIANSQHCQIYNIWGENWTEVINIGSDVAPETPSNFDVHAWDITCVLPNQTKTYYSIGFIANSSECSIKTSKQLSPIADGTPNGSGLATNVVENCEISDIYIPSLGRTASSEGILLQNASGCVIRNIHIGNAKSAVATFYTLPDYIAPGKPNAIDMLSVFNSDHALTLRSKHAIIGNILAINCNDEIFFGNSNASDNIITKPPEKISFNTDILPSVYLKNNTVAGWRYRYKYLRPVDILMAGDGGNANSITTNKRVTTKAAVDLHFLWNIPNYMRAITDVRFFLTFNTGALSGPNGDASFVLMQLRRMISFDGNANTLPYIELTGAKAATTNAITDTSFSVNADSIFPGYIPLGDSDNGLDASLDLLITMSNNVINNVMKEVRISYFGD